MLNKFISSRFWPKLILAGLVVLFWHPVLFNNSFFYDDMSFLRTFEAGGFSLQYILTPHNDHFMPFFKIIFYVIYMIFGANIVPCMILSISLHVVNSILFYILCGCIFPKSRWLPFLTAVFFAVNSSYYEVIHWFVVMNTAISLFFLQLSLIYLHRFIMENKKKLLIASSVLSFFIPFGFSLGLLGIVFIYLYAWFILKARNIRTYSPYLLAWGLFIVLYAVFVVAAGYSRTNVYSLNLFEASQYVLVGFFGAWFRTMGFSITAAPATLIFSAILALQIIFIGYFLILYFFLNRKAERVRTLGDRSILWFTLLCAALSYAAVAVGRSHLSMDVFLHWGRYQFFPIAFLSILLGNAALPIFSVFKKAFDQRRIFVFFMILFFMYLFLQYSVISQKSAASYRIEGSVPRVEMLG